MCKEVEEEATEITSQKKVRGHSRNQIFDGLQWIIRIGQYKPI